ncbi:MAG: hypothetical protein EB003_06990, partial [Flavobacteriia bacterium]|nr:hypothetical protein [Flavobacteriia bacterium]
FGPPGILSKKVAHLDVPRGGCMVLQRFPGGKVDGKAHQSFMEKKAEKGKDGLRIGTRIRIQRGSGVGGRT